VGSITYALKANKLLYKNGIKNTVIKNTDFRSSLGCGYSLELSQNNGEKAIQILRNNNIKILSTFKEGGEYVVF
ncbi:MAG: DUF3343 domain-containing protein, partial [Oscillospiraceae bacterium]